MFSFSFFDAIDRRDDTFYVVSFSGDHLLVNLFVKTINWKCLLQNSLTFYIFDKFRVVENAHFKIPWFLILLVFPYWLNMWQVPATNHSQANRPRMSLLLPAMQVSLNGGFPLTFSFCQLLDFNKTSSDFFLKLFHFQKVTVALKEVLLWWRLTVR